ncbi:MAG: metalloregulator ArsR/SmtB family transcription factor [Xanthomonadales bacterium]|jgi:ArsR family transcriptional regulator|nr:metalloregulator ArsR/SmtB family transcription factor [Xanthomonadales bacterium]
MQCTGASTAEKSGADAAAQDGQVDPQRMAIAAGQACELMKTLGHKDRLMVLCHLSSGEKSVGELAALLEISQSPLSQHLARMRKESLVKTRREAQTIYYSIASEEAARIVALMHELYCAT